MTTATTLATMGSMGPMGSMNTVWHDGVGVHWWFPVFPLLWFLVFWLVIGLVARRFWWRGGRSWQSGAEDALGKRYADGEIDEQEYRSRLAVLREGRRR